MSAARIIATGLSLVGRRSMLSTLPLVSHTVALVIRCFNEEAHIGRLLTGVVRQTHVPEEIIVVDSGSTDATLAIASAFPVEIVTICPGGLLLRTRAERWPRLS
jgi:cellulose synthase/poly-beta-1,6-N-acetylglucosamine synthase-like glycosyltransferase